jgi:hypothetical protein
MIVLNRMSTIKQNNNLYAINLSKQNLQEKMQQELYMEIYGPKTSKINQEKYISKDS